MNPVQASWIALLLAIAGQAGHAAPPIYRCGSSYSQFPCRDGREIEANDSRNTEQKSQADAATRRDADLARTLEKDRLARERAALAPAPVQRGTAGKSGKSGKTSHPPQSAASNAGTALTLIKPEKAKPRLERPKDFIAEVPGSRKSQRKKTDANAD